MEGRERQKIMVLWRAGCIRAFPAETDMDISVVLLVGFLVVL